MKAARIIKPKAPLEIAELTKPEPRGREVLVRVSSAGVCHSDLHLWEGGYDLGDGFLKVTDRGVKYPVTPGHEIAGIVDTAGPEAKVSKGQAVLVYPWLGCGSCPGCDAGTENLCDTPRSLGLFQDGGYAQYVKVPDYKYLAGIGDLDPDSATSLACAGLTAYSAVKKAVTDSPKNLVVIGAGGLGLMCIQIAKAVTKSSVICVDLDPAKLELARQMGADHTVDSSDKDGTISEIASLCGGSADAVIDFVNAPQTAKTGLEVLGKRGRLVMVGLFGGKLELPLVTIPLKSITIQGAYTGSYTDMVELIGLAQKGAINPHITRRYSLEEANTAFEDLRTRRINGRAVINP